MTPKVPAISPQSELQSFASLYSFEEVDIHASISCTPAGRSSDRKERFMFSAFLGDLLDVIVTLVETLSAAA
ncbi:hypothetical protein ACFU44_09360 [Nocardia rhizosphaerihabitans]|uniref:hypothetical protein n=1 Tax=Nocardia rhizosphaerihabitans TaxID=1691570 RepID=UPI00366BB587